MTGSDEQEFERVWRCAERTGLPQFVRATSYGTPSIKVEKAFLARLRDPGILAIACPMEEKPLLMEAASEIYFETDHYKGWPYILIRLDAVSDDELTHRFRIAWQMRASARLKKSVAL